MKTHASLSGVADWITIIAGSLTIFSILGAGWIYNRPEQASPFLTASQALGVLIAGTVITWAFVFFGQLRVCLRFARTHNLTFTNQFYYLTAVLATALFFGIELLLLEGILGFEKTNMELFINSLSNPDLPIMSLPLHDDTIALFAMVPTSLLAIGFVIAGDVVRSEVWRD